MFQPRNMIKWCKLSNYQLKKIIRCFCIDIDATKTSELLGFNRHTINRYFLLFRKAIYLDRTIKLESIIGEVGLDESYFGRKRIRGYHGKLKRGRGTIKQPVFGIFKRENILQQPEVYTEIVPDAKSKTLLKIIQGKVDPASIVYTDGWRGYDGLVSVGYDKHYRVNHGKNESALKGQAGDVVTVNGIESFWSFTKRRLAKFNGAKKYFELHLKESEWRWGKTTNQLVDELPKILKDFDYYFLA
jgi:transposase-like protein